MRYITVLFFLFQITFLFGQTPQKGDVLIGTAIGFSTLKLDSENYQSGSQTGMSFPNIKIGKMISNKTALLVYLPGTIYDFENADRDRQRGFEAILISAQYWVQNRIWLMGGIGLGLDAPVFYDIKTPEERNFNIGYSAAAAVGFDVLKFKKSVIDIQGRVHYGSIDIGEEQLKGSAFTILVGYNFSF